jgi:hypothetical protein
MPRFRELTRSSTLGIRPGMASDRLLLRAGLVLTVVTAGCTTVSTTLHHRVQRGDFTAYVDRGAARPAADTRLALVIEKIPAGTALLDASIATDPPVYCQVLPKLTGPTSRVDLVLRSARGTIRCLPIPLVQFGESPEWHNDQRFTVGVDLGLEGYPDHVGPVRQIVTIVGTLGVWVDRFRFEAGVGFGGAGCMDEECPVEEDSSTKIEYADVFPFHAGIQTALWEHHEISTGVGLRYRAVKLRADTYEGHESFWAHGPVIAPYVGAVPPFAGQYWGGARLALASVEVPVGYVIAENGERAVSIGVNLRLFISAF